MLGGAGGGELVENACRARPLEWDQVRGGDGGARRGTARLGLEPRALQGGDPSVQALLVAFELGEAQLLLPRAARRPAPPRLAAPPRPRSTLAPPAPPHLVPRGTYPPPPHYH